MEHPFHINLTSKCKRFSQQKNSIIFPGFFLNFKRKTLIKIRCHVFCSLNFLLTTQNENDWRPWRSKLYQKNRDRILMSRIYLFKFVFFYFWIQIYAYVWLFVGVYISEKCQIINTIQHDSYTKLFHNVNNNKNKIKRKKERLPYIIMKLLLESTCV